MPLDWPERPDDVTVVDVVKETTAAGEPCQLHVVLAFTRAGAPVGTRKLTVNPGFLRDHLEVPQDWDAEEDGDYYQVKFAAMFALIPDVPQAVKDGIRAKLTDKMLKELWLGRKL